MEISSLPFTARETNDFEATRAASHLYFFLLLSMPLAAVIALLCYWFDNDPHGYTAGIPGIAAILLLPLCLLARSGKVHLASHGLVLIGFVAVATAMLINRDGIRDSSALFFFVLLIVSTVYLGRRSTIGFGLLAIALVVLLGLGEWANWIETDFAEKPTDTVVVLLTGICLSTVLLGTTVRGRLDRTTKMRKQLATLRSKRRGLSCSLQESQAHLHRVQNENTRLRALLDEHQGEVESRFARMEDGLSSLAGGVAHNFNNLLMVVLSETEVALQGLAPDDAAAHHLRHAVGSAERAADLAQQLLLTAGATGPPHRDLMEINEQIRAQADTLRALAPGCDVTLELADEPLVVQADRLEIERVLTNLVTNAGEAMGHNTGVISITTAVEYPAREENEAAAPPGWLRLSIEDNGRGMPPSALERVFDPFYTTKASGGLGASVVRGVVEGLGGSIHMDSQPGMGTTVVIRLPLAPPPALEGIGKGASGPARTGTVLVVDDDLAVLEAIEQMLRSVGHSVMATSDPATAITLFAQHHREIDVVVLDMHMPRTSGVDTYRRMSEIAAGTPVVFASGHLAVDLTSELMAGTVYRFLQKPFSISQLANALQSVLPAD